MANRAIGLVLTGLGAAMLCGTFALGALAFLKPGILAGFSSLFPNTSGLIRGASYLVAIALLWVMGSTAAKALTHGMALLRSGQEG